METQKNKRPRWKMNGFDIIIIAVVLVAAAAVLFVWNTFGQSGGTATNAKPVYYTIELEKMVGDTADAVKEGDTIVDSAKKYVMGTVVSVTVVPATETKTDLTTGNTVVSEIPGKKTAIIELLCDCNESDSALVATSGYVIRIGTEVQAAGPGYAGLGYIVAIDREGETL